MNSNENPHLNPLAAIDKIVDTIMDPGAVQNITASDPVDGPKMRALSCAAMTAAAKVVTAGEDQAANNAAMTEMTDALYDACHLVHETTIGLMAKLGSAMMHVELSDLIDEEAGASEAAQKVAEEANRSAAADGIEIPEGARFIAARLKGKLNTLVGFAIAAAGGEEAFTKIQKSVNASLPPELAGTHHGFVMTIVGSITGAFHERMNAHDTIRRTISATLRTAEILRDFTVMPTLLTPAPVEKVVEITAQGAARRLCEPMDLKDASQPATDKPVRATTAEIIPFPQSKTVH